MKIAVFGTGYVGLVTATCFAEMGHTVHGVDIVESKVQRLMAGESVLFEPGLNDLLQKNLKTTRLHFSTNFATAIETSDVLFITVGSPSDSNGAADLGLVLKAIESIAETMISHKLIVIKSTVPVGSLNLIEHKIAEILKHRKLTLDFDVASNPEFLREGCAVNDCLTPDRIIIGTNSIKANEILKNVYALLIEKNIPVFLMDPNSAEMTKYAANSMLAARISLMNEISRLCEKLGADVDLVRLGVGSDHRIGPHMLHAGLGYGGSCFPKDVSALEKMGLETNENLDLLGAVSKTNSVQRALFFKKIVTKFPNLAGKTIAIWGLAFKPNTDDIREAPSLFLIEQLLQRGANIQAFDPEANINAKNYFHDQSNLTFFNDQYEVLKNADTLIIATEWEHFSDPDFSQIKKKLNQPIIFDGRNMFQPSKLKQLGIEYHSVGRASL